ncbi:hypothetical protein Naga_100089g8 [Nannochloropsis gaditana]|uniref:Uncharacterized protein n=1 Tax=Nannochloropsis gaditana TaxID=72520 RepID=W7TP20_9STRA|nr:hypothetical protein Naga_100089g8 [Nannochloropsis gaditana]
MPNAERSCLGCFVHDSRVFNAKWAAAASLLFSSISQFIETKLRLHQRSVCSICIYRFKMIARVDHFTKSLTRNKPHQEFWKPMHHMGNKRCYLRFLHSADTFSRLGEIKLMA